MKGEEDPQGRVLYDLVNVALSLVGVLILMLGMFLLGACVVFFIVLS